MIADIDEIVDSSCSWPANIPLCIIKKVINMNILYISKLSGNQFAGPNHSVPAQIRAQSSFDNVFWFNLNHVKRKEWTENGLDCKNLDDFPTQRLEDLPSPFNKPDLVVVEELYVYPFCRLILDIQKNNIPYIIVPRSQMTKQGQNKRKWKKILGNLFWFAGMIRKASAIHYLTENELADSHEQWKKHYFVIPNGISPQETVKDSFSSDRIRATYIGRFEVYQKGLDIMIEAIAKEQALLRENGFILNMHGPNTEKTVEKLTELITHHGISDLVVLHDAVYGEEKSKVLLDTDVFVMTSRFEGHPMGLIEALSYGVPCLITKGTNMSNEIVQYHAGWAADNTAESVGNAICDMIMHRHTFAGIGNNAVQLSKQYTWDMIAEQSHEAYKIILKEN